MILFLLLDARSQANIECISRSYSWKKMIM